MTAGERSLPTAPLIPGTDAAPDPAAVVAHMSSLLRQLEPASREAPAIGEAAQETSLIQARLGVGSSLFTALRFKHAPSATHSLRVALGCSSWAMVLGIRPPILDELEVAALLHDIGKIGVPDHLLWKTEKLTESEAQLLRNYRTMGLEILKSFCASEALLEIVRYAPAWYQPKTSDGEQPCGDQLPLGARMLAIVDAFDSMTTHHVYRSAKTRDEALEILADCAGTQFDPDLTRHFCQMQRRDEGQFDTGVARRWLEQISPPFVTPANSAAEVGSVRDTLAPLFLEKLIGSMRDGVVFVDRQLNVRLWNCGAQRLTGLPPEEAEGQSWRPRLIGLKDAEGRTVSDDDCPVKQVLQAGAQTIHRYEVTRHGGSDVAVDLHVVPVVGPDGAIHGANMLMHDVSSETSLAERVQTLHEKVKRDPLTQVANRAEFDRVHQSFMSSHAARDRPCSLIICDIDHFMMVNDSYGHQAGDEALKVFSQLLSEGCRTGDLVARYGGEEFVILCADCDLEGAVSRADQIRRLLENMPLESLSGKSITASFGVTEMQPDDDDQTMLRRADEALLAAKQEGRNRVMEVHTPPSESTAGPSWWNWRRNEFDEKPAVDCELITSVPLQVVAEQLRGFITDFDARRTTVDNRHLRLRVEPLRSGLLRRDSDRHIPILIDLYFTEEETGSPTDSRKGTIQTRVRVTMRPRRSRGRRRGDVVDHANHLLIQLRSYLMAAEADGEQQAVPRHTSLAGTWLER